MLRRILSIATSEDETRAIRKLSLMLVCNLSGCTEGRAALLDGGAVSVVIELIKQGFEEEHSIAALYGMSKMGLRFRGLAKEAGVEEVLAGVLETGEGVRLDMVRKVVQSLQADDVSKRMADGDWFDWNIDILDLEDDSVVSMGVGAFPQQRKEVRGGTGSNSNKF